MIWTIFTLEDGALIGLGEAHWVLVENSVFGVLKVIALVIIASEMKQFGIFLSWTFPVLLVVIPVNVFLFRRAIPRHSVNEPLEQIDARAMARFSAPDFAAGLIRTGTTTLMPIMVLAIVDASASGYALLAWNIGFTLFLLVNNVGASLITEVAQRPERVVEYTRKALAHSFAIIVPLALVTVVGAHVLLSLFRPEYARHATTLLQLIALSSIPNVVVATYVNLARAQRRMTAVFVTTAASSFGLLALSAFLLNTMGLDGLGIAWLIAYSATAVVIMLGDFRFVWWPQRADEPSSGRPIDLRTPD
jgi:O-antigen/teichoic acid export membrane protein